MEMDKILTQQGVYYKELKDNKEQLLKSSHPKFLIM